MSLRLNGPGAGKRLALFSAVLLTAWSGPLFQSPALGQLPELFAQPVLRVEEDWVLVLNEPDDLLEAPQFHTVMSPFGDLDSYYAQVTWNYYETPDFVAGGLQLQSWNGDSTLQRRTVDIRQLSTFAETITWTQILETDGVQLHFAIDHGNSTTWGEFGRNMRITADAGLLDLNGYTAAASATNSWITYGSNRVDSLVITQVRRYGATGLISVDATPRIVFELTDH